MRSDKSYVCLSRGGHVGRSRRSKRSCERKKNARCLPIDYSCFPGCGFVLSPSQRRVHRSRKRRGPRHTRKRGSERRKRGSERRKRKDNKQRYAHAITIPLMILITSMDFRKREAAAAKAAEERRRAGERNDIVTSGFMWQLLSCHDEFSNTIARMQPPNKRFETQSRLKENVSAGEHVPRLMCRSVN